MTEKEADIILLESLLQTPNSRADYFRRKAIEGNHDPVTFFHDLNEAYKRIESYVNSSDYKVWWYDEKGIQVFPKKYLWLLDYTNGRMRGNLGSENLIELLKPLHEFGKSLQTEIKSRITANESKDKDIRIKSFSWTGSDEQLKKLYDGLIQHGYIDGKTDFKDFTAIFSGDPIDNLLPVTWIKQTQKSKTIAKSAVITLFDLLAENKLVKGDEIKNKAEFFRKLQSCFSDPAGNLMKFTHKNSSYSKDSADLLNKIITSL